MSDRRNRLTSKGCQTMLGRRQLLGAGVGLAASTFLAQGSSQAQDGEAEASGDADAAALTAEERAMLEQEVTDLSKDKWRWMAERDIEALDALFHEEAVFVHMGGAMSKEQELGVIRGGAIQYREADIHETSVRFIDATAILLSRIHLLAVVGGNEVINPFMVTEVYVRQGEAWKLGSLSFTRLLGD